MSGFLLAPHAYLCRTQHHVVLLDLRQDKYFALDQIQSQALGVLFPQLREPNARDLQGNDHNTAAFTHELVTQGILTTDSSIGRHFTPLAVETPTRALADEYLLTEIPIRPHHVARFVQSYIWARLVTRCRSIEAIVRGVQARKQTMIRTPTADQTEQVRQLYTVFERLRPWLYTGRDACLFDAITLAEFLSRYQLPVAWVFGVKTAPFAAHCWIQMGDLVLNDIPDTVRRYTPIMAI